MVRKPGSSAVAAPEEAGAHGRDGDGHALPCSLAPKDALLLLFQ